MLSRATPATSPSVRSLPLSARSPWPLLRALRWGHNMVSDVTSNMRPCKCESRAGRVLDPAYREQLTFSSCNFHQTPMMTMKELYKKNAGQKKKTLRPLLCVLAEMRASCAREKCELRPCRGYQSKTSFQAAQLLIFPVSRRKYTRNSQPTSSRIFIQTIIGEWDVSLSLVKKALSAFFARKALHHIS